VAIAVSDIDAMSDILDRVFGLKKSYSEDFPDHGTEIAMFPVGETNLELLQGYTPEARAAKWLSKNGESLYHLCFEVEDLEEALDELRSKGVRLLNEQPITGHGGSRVAFIDPESTGDVLFELVETSHH
ncbi:MAG: VOC family protein, partial [Cytophagaceae bacterium]